MLPMKAKVPSLFKSKPSKVIPGLDFQHELARFLTTYTLAGPIESKLYHKLVFKALALLDQYARVQAKQSELELQLHLQTPLMNLKTKKCMKLLLKLSEWQAREGKIKQRLGTMLHRLNQFHDIDVATRRDPSSDALLNRSVQV
jgi:hypothetical protein